MEAIIGATGSLTLSRTAPVGWRLRNFFAHAWKGDVQYWAARLLGQAIGLVTVRSALRLVVHQGDGTTVDYGVVGRRVVTTAGVAYLVDAFQNLTELELLKYHGFGTGSTAEAVGDTALVTELTTQYNPDSTRPTGSLAEGATGNIFRTVATLTPDTGSPAITEHGVFSAATAGVLLDRTVFAAVNLVAANGDSLQATYELTITAGG